MTRVALVLFDMNDVLCRYDKAVRIARLAALAGRPPEAIEQAIWGSGFEDQGDAGAFGETAYLEGFGERIGFRLTVEEWIAALKAAVAPIADSIALAATLKRTTRVAVLTNNNLLIRSTIDRILPELAAIFGGDFHVSAEFKARKPDSEAYRRCLAALGVAPEATLFVDDSAKNIAGAEQAMLITHRFTSPDGLAAHLTSLGLLAG